MGKPDPRITAHYRGLMKNIPYFAIPAVLFIMACGIFLFFSALLAIKISILAELDIFCRIGTREVVSSATFGLFFIRTKKGGADLVTHIASSVLKPLVGEVEIVDL